MVFGYLPPRHELNSPGANRFRRQATQLLVAVGAQSSDVDDAIQIAKNRGNVQAVKMIEAANEYRIHRATRKSKTMKMLTNKGMECVLS